MAIYEFSTGINIQTDAQGNWWSIGYLGGWMYNTYRSGSASDIPYPIQQAYDNKEFAVGQNDKSEFTIMGRVISLNNEIWSVVAFLTYASDERGRRVPTYRFFFGEDSTAINEILRRIITFEKDHNTLPVFNHLGATNLGQYTLADPADINHQIGNDINPEVLETPDIRTYVLEPDTCVVNNSYALRLFKLNRLALNRARAIGEAGNVSWAYNADVLQRPETFILIEAANKNAYSYLRSKRSGGIVKYQAGINEQGIKAALKGLIEYEDIDKSAVEDLQFLATAILALGSEAEVYVRNIAKGLGLSEQSLLHQTHPELIKLDIVLSVFFPNIKKQLEVWQRLSNSGWDNLIAKYTEKIKKYISEAKIDHLLREANQEIVKYCFDNIDFTASSVDSRRTEYIVWILTKSLWSSAATIDLLYKYITEEIDQAFKFSKEKAFSNRDKFKLENYLRSLRGLTVSVNSVEFVWRWLNLLEINYQNTAIENKLKELEKKIKKPELRYEQIISILYQLSIVDIRFKKVHDFFKIINLSFDNQLIRLLSSQQSDSANQVYTIDSLDRLKVDNHSIKELQKARNIGLINLAVSVIAWICIIGSTIFITKFVTDGFGILLVFIFETLKSKLLTIIILVIFALLIPVIWIQVKEFFFLPKSTNSTSPSENEKVSVPPKINNGEYVQKKINDLLKLLKNLSFNTNNDVDSQIRPILVEIFKFDSERVSEAATKVLSQNLKRNLPTSGRSRISNSSTIFSYLLVPNNFKKYIFKIISDYEKDNSGYLEIKDESSKYQRVFNGTVSVPHKNLLKKEIFESLVKLLIGKLPPQSKNIKKIKKESILDVLLDLLSDDNSIVTIEEFVPSLDNLVRGKKQILNDNIPCENTIFEEFDLLLKNYSPEQGDDLNISPESSYITNGNGKITNGRYLLLARFLHKIVEYTELQDNGGNNQRTPEQVDIVSKSINLAAVFYQIAQDGAPEEIYGKLDESKQAYGIPIKMYCVKEPSKLQVIFAWIKEHFLASSRGFKITIVIITIASIFILGTFFGQLSNNLNSSTPQPTTSPSPTASATTPPSPTVSPTPSPLESAPKILNVNTLETAKQEANYNATIISMQAIVSECKQRITPIIVDKKIRERINNALTDGKRYSNMDIEKIVLGDSKSTPNEFKETFLQLIAQFQKVQFPKSTPPVTAAPDGIVSSTGETYQLLKQKVCP